MFGRAPYRRARGAGDRAAPGPPRDESAPAKPEVFRLTGPIVIWWVWLAFAVVNIVDVAVQGSARFAIVVAAVLATITGVAYACALRPRVVASDAGLTVLNPFRDHRVPWGAVHAVDAHDWVRVHCGPVPGADGPARWKTIDCWALFAPARSRLKAERRARDPAVRSAANRLPEEARGLVSLSAAQAIAHRLDERARRERARGAAAAAPTATWAWISLAAMAVPAVALIIAAVAA